MDPNVGLVGLTFCPNCGNVLKPRENQSHTKLYYYCRTCHHVQPAAHNCIHAVKILQEANELKYISPEVIHDPTLPTTADHPCPKCESREAVFFQSYFRGGEEKMRMYYVCTKAECAHKWTQADLRT